MPATNLRTSMIPVVILEGLDDVGGEPETLEEAGGDT